MTTSTEMINRTELRSSLKLFSNEQSAPNITALSEILPQSSHLLNMCLKILKSALATLSCRLSPRSLCLYIQAFFREQLKTILSSKNYLLTQSAPPLGFYVSAYMENLSKINGTTIVLTLAAFPKHLFCYYHRKIYNSFQNISLPLSFSWSRS